MEEDKTKEPISKEDFYKVQKFQAKKIEKLQKKMLQLIEVIEKFIKSNPKI